MKRIVMTFTLALAVLGIASMKQSSKPAQRGTVTIAQSCCDDPPPPCPPCDPGTPANR
jgi:hypothetical protein